MIETLHRCQHRAWKEGEERFEKDFFKLMNNSVFGKTMENIKKHKDIKLITNEKAYLRNVMKPNFKSGMLFGENLMGCEMGKIKVIMNKPVYLGQAILDLSKIVMYYYFIMYFIMYYVFIYYFIMYYVLLFHYVYMKPKYCENLKLCYKDTDSLVYHIKTEDFYEDIAKDVKVRFDTIGYKKEDARPLPIGLNKKIIGLMKDELGGEIVTEFVAFRPKLYAYRKLDDKRCEGIKKCVVKEDKRCKGIKKCVVKEMLDFDD